MKPRSAGHLHVSLLHTMGTFGAGIKNDDVVLDVIDYVVDCLKHGDSVGAACTNASVEFSELRGDIDDGPLYWLALAYVQWKYGGHVDRNVIDQIRSDIVAGRGVERWENNPNFLTKRILALNEFLKQIETNNPKPSPSPRLVVRKAPFQPGDCLSIRMADGRYTAALILGSDNSDPEYGSNLVACLDYLSSLPPTESDFVRRPWLQKHYGNWNGELELGWYFPAGFKAVKARLSVVARVELNEADPKESKRYPGWEFIDQSIRFSREYAGG